MNMEELQHHLDFENIGNAPRSVKLGVFAFLFVLIVGLGVYFDTTKQLKELERAERKEAELKVEFEDKAKRAAQLELYK